MEFSKISWQSVVQILAFLGILDSLYLINVHAQPGICTVTDTPFGIPLDCGTVARSSYSEFIGIPIAIFGVLFYLSVVIIFSYYDKLKLSLESYPVDRAIIVFLSMSFIVTLYLLYLQLFVILAICLYCMVSLLSTSIIFFFAVFNLEF